MHNIEPINIFTVNFSLKTNIDKTKIVKIDKETAAGYTILKFVLDNKYNQAKNPIIYKTTPPISLISTKRCANSDKSLYVVSLKNLLMIKTPVELARVYMINAIYPDFCIITFPFLIWRYILAFLSFLEKFFQYILLIYQPISTGYHLKKEHSTIEKSTL